MVLQSMIMPDKDGIFVWSLLSQPETQKTRGFSTSGHVVGVPPLRCHGHTETFKLYWFCFCTVWVCSEQLTTDTKKNLSKFAFKLQKANIKKKTFVKPQTKMEFLSFSIWVDVRITVCAAAWLHSRGCVCACMHLCGGACMYALVYLCAGVYVCVHQCAHLCIRVMGCTSVCVCMHLCVFVLVCMRVYISVFMHAFVCLCNGVCVLAYVCVQVYISALCGCMHLCVCAGCVDQCVHVCICV